MNAALRKLIRSPLARVLSGYIGAALLFVVFARQGDWSWAHAAQAPVAWLPFVAAVMVRLSALLVSAVRWRWLLRPAGAVRWTSLISATMVGMTATTLLSVQAAEFVRPWFLSRIEHLSLSSVLATVILEWPLDLLAVVSIFVAGLTMLGPLAPGPAAAFARLPQALLVLSLLAAALLAALWCLSRYGGKRTTTASAGPENLLGRFRTACRMVLEQALRGLGIVRVPRAFATVCIASIVISALDAVTCSLALSAFGLSLPVGAAPVVLGMVALGGLIPTPAAAGGIHALCQLGLSSFFHVAPADSLLPIIGLHIVFYVPAALWGGVCLLACRIPIANSAIFPEAGERC